MKVLFNYPKKKLDAFIFKFYKKVKGFGVNLVFEHKPTLGNYILVEPENQNYENKIKIYTEISNNNMQQFEKIKNNYIESILDFCNKNNYIFDKSSEAINFETNNHHHGGTIFGDDSDKNPVDKNNNLRGFKNMYINGSSVFPSSSNYGPTFTIMALSLRLADIIKKLYIKKT